MMDLSSVAGNSRSCHIRGILTLVGLGLVMAMIPARVRAVAPDVASVNAEAPQGQELTPLPQPPAESGVKPDGAFRPVKVWSFDRTGNLEGWTVPPGFGGVVSGGSMWLTIRDPQPTEHRVFALKQLDIASPKGLKIPASTVKKVRLRLLNLSPETEGFLLWTVAEKPDGNAGTARFAMKSYDRQWQDVICHVDDRWSGTIDQIRLMPAMLNRTGDIYIQSIAITDGVPQSKPERPDLISERVVPHITLPGITQSDFQQAFNVLDECLVVNVPCNGFMYPLLAPGGAYGLNWWQLDSSLNILGCMWANPRAAENTVRGFIGVQAENPDGRIDLHGGSPIRGCPGDISSVPRYFEAAYAVACRSGDRELRERILESMIKYADWWLAPSKFSAEFGLVTAFAEETLSGVQTDAHIIAPVDTNVAVALGCDLIADLADQLGHPEQARKYRAAFESLRENINRFMWDEARGAYYSVNVRTHRRQTELICTTFDTLRCGIAPPERQSVLIKKLLDPKLFNWGKIPVTSIALTNPKFCEATGQYDGRAWFGDVWTMRNVPIIKGLEDIGRHDLAAELAWQTIKAFNNNYREYLTPIKGTGEGVVHYGWSAAQYIQVIIETIYGVDYDNAKARLRIVPHVPAALDQETLSIKELILPTGQGAARLTLSISPLAQNSRTVSLKIKDAPPHGQLEVFLPVAQGQPLPKVFELSTGKRLKVVGRVEGLRGLAGVQLPLRDQVALKFEF